MGAGGSYSPISRNYTYKIYLLFSILYIFFLIKKTDKNTIWSYVVVSNRECEERIKYRRATIHIFPTTQSLYIPYLYYTNHSLLRNITYYVVRHNWQILRSNNVYFFFMVTLTVVLIESIRTLLSYLSYIESGCLKKKLIFEEVYYKVRY